jgi:hypothetical protein
MLAAPGCRLRDAARTLARCVFATMHQALFAIDESGFYRSRDCRNPSLIAPSTDAPKGV